MLESTSPSATGIRDLLDHNPVVGEMRSGTRRFWTGREEKILREQYPVSGVSGCVELLPGRSAYAIYNRAGQLGLRVPHRSGNNLRKRWSSNEPIDRVICDVYQRAPKKNDINRLATTVGRPRWWVSKRAQKLGLVAPRFKEPQWSEDEIDFVSARSHLHPHTIRLALKRAGFNRTETAIVVKLKRLGQPTGKAADDNHYTATALSKLFGIDAKSVTRWIIRGWLKADKRGTERTEQQGGDEWWIHRRDVRRFVIENAAAVDIRKVDKFWFIDLLTGAA